MKKFLMIFLFCFSIVPMQAFVLGVLARVANRFPRIIQNPIIESFLYEYVSFKTQRAQKHNEFLIDYHTKRLQEELRRRDVLSES